MSFEMNYNSRDTIRLGIGAALVLLIGFIIYSSVYTIRSGTVGVLSTFGKYSNEVIQPGLHFKVPFAQKVYIFDVKLHAANYVGTEDLRDHKNQLIRDRDRTESYSDRVELNNIILRILAELQKRERDL